MFHKIKSVTPLSNYRISVEFLEGITKIYDMQNLIKNNELFQKLSNRKLFLKVQVDTGGYGIVWDDSTDISCNELFENGVIK